MKTIKIKVLEKSIKQAEKRIKLLKAKIFASPVVDIMELEQKTLEHVKENLHDCTGNLKVIAKAEKLRKKLFMLAEDQSKNSVSWMDELTTIESELHQYKNELWRAER